MADGLLAFYALLASIACIVGTKLLRENFYDDFELLRFGMLDLVRFLTLVEPRACLSLDSTRVLFIIFCFNYGIYCSIFYLMLSAVVRSD